MDRNDKGNSGRYGRRVNNTPEPVFIQSRKRQPEFKRHTKSELEQKQRYNKKQKQKRLKMKRIRAAVILLLIIVAVAALMLMTPLFNIRSITVEGNKYVTLQQIDEKVHDISRQNLFKVSSGNIKERLKSIAYIEDVDVAKKLFPPSVKITVKECIPAGYIVINGYEVVVDSQLKVLGDDNKFSSENIPEIKGMENDSYTVGKTFESANEEKQEVMVTCLKTMESTGIINKVDNIDISNLTGIKFRYDNRIDALCGTQLDLDRKIRLFRETVYSNSIAENAKGTVDLSITGKAVYIP